MGRAALLPAVLTLCLLLGAAPAALAGQVNPDHIRNPGLLKPTDSVLKVRVGQPAPDFSLPSLSGQRVSLREYRGLRYVIVSFVPAAFTPVCSDQWPGYNLAQEELEKRQAVVLGITVDNLPALHAWTKEMGGCWFPVLSDFFPHGEVAGRFGVLRSDGTSERAVFIVDKRGVLRLAEVYDINSLPRIEALLQALDAIIAEDSKQP